MWAGFVVVVIWCVNWLRHVVGSVVESRAFFVYRRFRSELLKINWNLLKTSYFEHFFYLMYDVIIDILQSMVLFTIMETFTVVSYSRNNVELSGIFWNHKFSIKRGRILLLFSDEH